MKALAADSIGILDNNETIRDEMQASIRDYLVEVKLPRFRLETYERPPLSGIRRPKLRPAAPDPDEETTAERRFSELVSLAQSIGVEDLTIIRSSGTIRMRLNPKQVNRLKRSKLVAAIHKNAAL